MTNPPPLTIGVLTIPGRLELVKGLFKSLSDTIESYNGYVEVLIAGQEVESAISMAQNALNCPVEYIKTDGTAPLGRNRIVKATTTEWLLFVDDDCRVDEDLLNEYAAAIKKADENVGAIYGPLLFEGNQSLAFEAYRFTPYIHPLQIAMWRDTVEWVPTANALFSTSAVREVGNFDIGNPIHVSGEDVDIGLQLTDAGYKLKTVSSARIYHKTDSWNSFLDNLSRVYTYGRSEVWLVDQYPERTSSIFDVGFGLNSSGFTALFGLLALSVLTIPLLALLWVSTSLCVWLTTDRSTSPIAYFISDIYKISNLFGYITQTIREDVPISRVTQRFEFYTYEYIHPRIRDEGVWTKENRR